MKHLLFNIFQESIINTFIVIIFLYTISIFCTFIRFVTHKIYEYLYPYVNILRYSFISSYYHELAHLFFSVIFLNDIIDVEFSGDKPRVVYQYNKNNYIQNAGVFFNLLRLILLYILLSFSSSGISSLSLTSHEINSFFSLIAESPI